MAVRTRAAVLAMGLGAIGCHGAPGDKGDDTSETTQAVTTQTQSFASALASSSQDLGGFRIQGFEPATLSVFDLTVTAQSKWQASVTTDVTWDADKVRQGQHLDVARVASGATGVVKVLWSISGTLRPLDLFDVNIGPIPLSVDVNSCAPVLDASAGTFDCNATSDHLSLVDTPGIPASPFVDLAIGVRFSVTPDGGLVTRNFFIGDTAVAPQADLGLTTSTATETLDIPCSRPAGDNVEYALDPYHWAPAGTTATQQPEFVIGIRDPLIGAFKISLFDAPFGPAVVTNPDFQLDGTGTSLDFGALQANNVPPTIAPLGPFSGSEGSPVHFGATTTSQCPITSYVWHFSDGTTSFGPSPQRSFADDAVFDGELTVTDSTNLSANGDFTVSIANVPPVPYAGPDTSGPWNRPIALHGQAVDPGADDQATLTYAWNFGDGTPGSGGADVVHLYATPGDYLATLTVCDDHTCVPSSTHVHVRKRTTTVAYTGANTGVFSSTATLAGSIVDEFGQPVSGGGLSFALNGVFVGSAFTDSTGNGSRTQDIVLDAGSYPVTASFAGNLLYEGGSAGVTFGVTRMPSLVSYSGATSGGSNKVVPLSAKLVDGLSRPLAGKPIVFTLGTQTATATTGADGVASTTLKLSQHNGSYTLTAAWTPAGGDTTKWFGATTSTTFSIGGK